jgi:alcohol dehydrogenase
MKGDVPTVIDGRTLGHEGVGIIEEAGNSATRFKKGDHVLISCITSCGKCEYCRRAIYSHCVNGGWILGNLIDGTQAEYVRIPYADNSLYSIPPDGDEEALVMLSDILPIGFECGVLNGKVKPGDTIAIVGAGPICMAALLTAQLLFKNVQSGKLNPKKLITHHYKLEQIIQAYDTFEHASKEKALKIILTNQESVC